MGRLGRSAALLVIITTWTVTPAWPDVVELKTGQKVEGTFKGADEAAVRVEVGGQVITFKPDQVRAIYYGAAPAERPVAPPLRDEAIRALRGVESITTGGTTYREYVTRANDAKIVVDRYLQDRNSSGPERAAISGAMGFYAVAGVVWGALITRRPVAPQDLRLLPGACRHATTQNELYRGMWVCASERIAEAEKLLGGGKK
jgi:hypothetical protein